VDGIDLGLERAEPVVDFASIAGWGIEARRSVWPRYRGRAQRSGSDSVPSSPGQTMVGSAHLWHIEVQPGEAP